TITTSLRRATICNQADSTLLSAPSLPTHATLPFPPKSIKMPALILVYCKHVYKDCLYLHSDGPREHVRGKPSPRFDVFYATARRIGYLFQTTRKYEFKRDLGSMDDKHFARLQDRCQQEYVREENNGNWIDPIIRYLQDNPLVYPDIIPPEANEVNEHPAVYSMEG
ncbi:hypothetical protein BDV95DRAFT_643179, partial [Massariosphaeria phaeospora]